MKVLPGQISDPPPWEIASGTSTQTTAITDPDSAAAKRAFDAMMEISKIDIAATKASRRG